MICYPEKKDPDAPQKRTPYWRTLEGEAIRLSDLTDSHLKNIIGMLTRNNRLVAPVLYEEDLQRNLKRIVLESDELALWLLSNNPKIREFAV